ncbi:MAG: PDZ domain-containing protein, partial [Tepidisphaeraceae bacterium]
TAEAFGMTLGPVTDESVERFGLGDLRQGALITDVARGSAAAEAGLRPGDVITRIDNEPVKTPADVRQRVSKLDTTKGVRFYVTSRDGSRFVFLRADKD